MTQAMKTLITSIVAASLSVAAHADVLAKKGARTTLHVEYIFDSAGEAWSTSKDQHNSWSIKRTVIIDAQFVADEPRAFGVMHDKDSAQQKNIEGIQGKAESAMAKATPTMNDMMKIVVDCGGGDSKESQACIEKKVSNYGNTMSDAQVDQLKSTRTDIAGIQKATTGSRFQLWKLESQSGSYEVNEKITHRVFEMTCTAIKVCQRETVIRGSGPLVMPPGAKTIASAAMFEVDTVKRDVKLQLPVPLTPLETKQSVVTTIPGETGGDTKTVLSPFYLKDAKVLTLALPASLGLVSGRKVIPVPGQYHEGGMITVTWRIWSPQ